MGSRTAMSRWLFWGLIALCLLAVVGAAFVAVQYATASSLGEVLPPDGAVVGASEVVVSASLPGYKPGSGTIEMLIDAEPVPAASLELVPGAARTTVTLRDGTHWVRVTLSSSNLFARREVTRWSFAVDSTPPSITVTSPDGNTSSFSTRPAQFEVSSREPVEAQLTVDGAEVALEGEGPAFRASIDLSAGSHVVVAKATDQAGHTTTKTWTAYADYSAPVVEAIDWPADPWDEPQADLVLAVTDDQPEGIEFTAVLDGEPVAVEASDPPDGGEPQRFQIVTGDLPEGEHVLEYTVTDRGGNEFARTDRILVDSTERFGEREMGPGALGRDVTELQRILVRKEFLQGEPTGTFDETTSAALIDFKRSKGFDTNPILDRETMVSLLGAIVIDRSERKLYLYDGDTVVKTFRVAVGQPRYPTPTGSYVIINKVYNPTWSPPPSPWAEGLEPVPPGPGNPLGTRWMGLSAPHVGIHGTYQGWSIGTAASHGCIRMHIRDVEELFELVYVGTPVDIVP